MPDKSKIDQQNWRDGTPIYRVVRSLEILGNASCGVTVFVGDFRDICQLACVLLNQEKNRILGE